MGYIAIVNQLAGIRKSLYIYLQRRTYKQLLLTNEIIARSYDCAWILQSQILR